MDIGEVKEAEELVFGRGFVVGQVRGAQDEPAFLPGLGECIECALGGSHMARRERNASRK